MIRGKGIKRRKDALFKQETSSPSVSARCKRKLVLTKEISVEEKHKEKVLPELVEPARNVSVAHNHEAMQPSINKKRRLVLPSYSSASEEDEV